MSPRDVDRPLRRRPKRIERAAKTGNEPKSPPVPALPKPQSSAAGAEREVDPRERTDWFRRLPPATREEFVRVWRDDSLRDVELARRERRRTWIAAARMSALFGIGDLFCPGGSIVAWFAALAGGAALGWLLDVARADRIASGIGGLLAFAFVQSFTRGGLSVLHLMVFFPFASACAYLGYLREEPDWI